MVSNINFVKDLRRVMTAALSPKANGHTPGGGPGGSNGGDDGHGHNHINGSGGASYDEESPLLGRVALPRAAMRRNHWPSWLRVLVDVHHTPGCQSPNVAVKALANSWHVTKISLASSPVNVLIVFAPVGVAAAHLGWSPTWVFTLNFLAIMPLAAILSFATEEISVKLGETAGGLVNATFGNAVELIVSVIALRQGQIEVVQASMLGSILSNLLLVMGMCFLLGGIANMRDGNGQGSEQSFASATAQTTCSLMTLAAASMIIPATLYGILDDSNKAEKDASILLLSRGTSIILLFLYALYLWFQLNTHKNLFVTESETEAETSESSEDAEEEEHMTWWAAAIVLVAVTVVIAFCADYLVEAIEPIAATGVLSKAFIGLILIPIVGNAAEHVTACVVAVRNKMDLAMGVAIGSSIQIALLVTPSLVIAGWLILDQPMSLRFETFQTVAFALSVLVVTYTVQDGKSNYLEGAMLLGLYIIIALAFYASPGNALDSLKSVF